MEKCFNITGAVFPRRALHATGTWREASRPLRGAREVPLHRGAQDALESWNEKIYTRDEVLDGKTLRIIGLEDQRNPQGLLPDHQSALRPVHRTTTESEQ